MTDYLPGHYEELTITNVTGNKVTFSENIQWPHSGTRYALGSRMSQDVQTRLTKAGMDKDLVANGAETRAAVALLTRSIRIVSAGDKVGQTWEQASAISANCKANPPTATPQAPYCYYFGAHVVFRQGFEQVQIQGVEFKDLGQGGKMGHYPIHFHMARQVPTDTFVKDSSIYNSMTRWIVLHATQGVLLQRNVGFKSIGHGFYLESGTEADNKFYSNLGVFTRAAIDNNQNPRKIPGILSAKVDALVWVNDQRYDPTRLDDNEAFPYRSDYDHPAAFWITNGWNDFIGNMAAGVGACGSAYWFVPAWNSDMPDAPTADNQQFGTHMKWLGYAALQKNSSYAGSTPLKSFFKNYATTSMNSFIVIPKTTQCFGIDWAGKPLNANKDPHIFGIPSFAPLPIVGNRDKDMYYPHMEDGGSRQPVQCEPKTNADGVAYNDCGTFTRGEKPRCDNGAQLPLCAVIVLDHFTSSFHWAHFNFSALWLRPQWYLLTNMVLTDVQGGGLTALTSGGYDRSSVIEGAWALARTSIFAGHTQPTGTSPFSGDAGPFGGATGALKCDGRQTTEKPPQVANPKAYCLNADQGVSFPLVNFGTAQRLFSIYDGPMYQDSNAYLDITKTPCTDCMYANTPGVRRQIVDDKDRTKDVCYLPNAAIAWKQPNGFFYPPSFHSTNLFFDKVEIRHYVIDALNKENTYIQKTTETGGVADAYCKPISDAGFATDLFGSFTDIDRQTELNDDDGSLTGLTNVEGTGTISVNPVEFFSAPVETAECLSNLEITPQAACPTTDKPPMNLPRTSTPLTAKTSPYDYVTTVVFPSCAVGPGGGSMRCGSAGAPDTSLKPGGTFGPDGDGKHFNSKENRGGQWSQSCADPACYDVPLYRQLLTGTGTNPGDSTREVNRWFHEQMRRARQPGDGCLPLAYGADGRAVQLPAQYHDGGPWCLFSRHQRHAGDPEHGRVQRGQTLPNARQVGGPRLRAAQRQSVPGRPDLLHVLPLPEADHPADLSDLCRPELQPEHGSEGGQGQRPNHARQQLHRDRLARRLAQGLQHRRRLRRPGHGRLRRPAGHGRHEGFHGFGCKGHDARALQACDLLLGQRKHLRLRPLRDRSEGGGESLAS